MNIETLQIKRITGNWDGNPARPTELEKNGYKTYKPAKGEFVLISVPGHLIPVISELSVTGSSSTSEPVRNAFSEVLVLGNGSSTLEELVNERDSKVYLPALNIINFMKNMMAKYLSTDTPTDVAFEDSSNMSGDFDINTNPIPKISQAGHTHKMNLANMFKAMDDYIKDKGYGVSSNNDGMARLRCIYTGTQAPTSGVGNNGDIYIKY